ncbi:hypothetical protein ACFWNH_29325 [Rhodococcus qingshengii]|uniref:hypothetical protein n=1 Tax=Rhodococcus qingshengii TaxID=334542 RepID=UPI003660971C
MDAGEVIAVAAVVAAFAGVAGAFIGTLVAESTRAENARRELLMTARIAVYGQFLAATSRILSSALNRASNSATRDEAAAYELNQIIAEIQVIGGVGVRAALKDFLEHVSDAEQSAADHGREARIAQDILARDNFYNVLRSVTRSDLEATIKADCSALEDAMHTELSVCKRAREATDACDESDCPLLFGQSMFDNSPRSRSSFRVEKEQTAIRIHSPERASPVLDFGVVANLGEQRGHLHRRCRCWGDLESIPPRRRGMENRDDQ